MTLIIGRPEGEHTLLAPVGLKEIWVRRPTDLFDPSVPLTVFKLPGDPATEWRHCVQTPDGCDLYTNPLIEQGTALLVFEGGEVWTANGRLYRKGNVKEVKGRKRTAFSDGGRAASAGVLVKMPKIGAFSGADYRAKVGR